jgi:hypothetical protein
MWMVNVKYLSGCPRFFQHIISIVLPYDIKFIVPKMAIQQNAENKLFQGVFCSSQNKKGKHFELFAGPGRHTIFWGLNSIRQKNRFVFI